MAEPSTSKKKPLIPPKIVAGIAIGLAVIGIVFFFLSGYFAKQSRVKLVERAQTTERESADDSNPTPEVYQKNVKQVLHRSEDTTATLRFEVDAFESLVSKLPSEFQYTYFELQNFLGKNKLHVEFTLDSEDKLESATATISEQCREYLQTYPSISRIYYTFYTETDRLACGYFCLENEVFNVVNLPPVESISLNTVLDSSTEEFNTLNQVLDSYLTIAYELDLTTDGSKYALDLKVDTASSESGVAELLDVFDQIFFAIQNDFNLPVQLRIKDDTGIVVSGLIDPTDKLFSEFYTDKPFYQDISRAEYYICNEWLFGELNQSLTTMLNNIV